MGMYHFAYKFPVENFLKEVRPIIACLEKGIIQPLYDRAIPTYENALRLDRRDRIPAILDHHGYLYYWGQDIPPLDLLDEEDVRALLMIVLAEYLSPSKASLADHWHLFGTTLTMLGWEDSDLLVCGVPTPYLLRPTFFPPGETFRSLVQTRRYRREPPLWQWLGGTMDGGTGWLSPSRVQGLQNRLASTQNQVMEATDRTLTAILRQATSQSPHLAGLYRDITTPQRQKYLLLELFDRAQAMLTGAAKEKMGLFLTISG